MLSHELAAHAGEFNRYLANNHYEITDTGIAFPLAGVEAQGFFTHDINGQDEQVDENLVVNEGLIYLLQVGLSSLQKQPNWYIALNGNNYTPVATLKGSAYPSTAGEIVSQTEGYAEASRQPWNPVLNASGEPVMESNSNKASFTLATADTITIYGAALLSGNVRGSVADTLLSCVKFEKPRVGYDTDVFSLGYSVGLRARA